MDVLARLGDKMCHQVVDVNGDGPVVVHYEGALVAGHIVCSLYIIPWHKANRDGCHIKNWVLTYYREALDFFFFIGFVG